MKSGCAGSEAASFDPAPQAGPLPPSRTQPQPQPPTLRVPPTTPPRGPRRRPLPGCAGGAGGGGGPQSAAQTTKAHDRPEEAL
jgi:hypothetical protein